MTRRPRIPRATAADILAAIDAAAIPTPPTPPVDVAQLRAYRDAIARVRDVVDGTPVVPARLAWQWRQLAGIAADLDYTTGLLLRRAGVAV